MKIEDKLDKLEQTNRSLNVIVTLLIILIAVFVVMPLSYAFFVGFIEGHNRAVLSSSSPIHYSVDKPRNGRFIPDSENCNLYPEHCGK